MEEASVSIDNIVFIVGCTVSWCSVRCKTLCTCSRKRKIVPGLRDWSCHRKDATRFQHLLGGGAALVSERRWLCVLLYSVRKLKIENTSMPLRHNHICSKRYGIRPVSEGHGGTAPFDLTCNNYKSPRCQSSCSASSSLSNLKGDSAG